MSSEGEEIRKEEQVDQSNEEKLNQPVTCEPTPVKGDGNEEENPEKMKTYDYLNGHERPLIKEKIYDTRYQI